jgi:ribosomal protein S18 acetylase RimI-like enzyme
MPNSEIYKNPSFQNILTTTEEIILEKGCRSTKLKDIIERSGLSKHRLVVHPDFQGRGYGKSYFSLHAANHGFTSIRFDVYSENKTAISMYERAGYQQRGMIRYPFRSIPYPCYEKIL